MGVLLRGARSLHLESLPLPAVPVEVDARRGAKEPLLVPIGLLGDLSVKDNEDLVAPLPQVPLHGLPRESLLLWAVDVSKEEHESQKEEEQEMIYVEE